MDASRSCQEPDKEHKGIKTASPKGYRITVFDTTNGGPEGRPQMDLDGRGSARETKLNFVA